MPSDTIVDAFDTVVAHKPPAIQEAARAETPRSDIDQEFSKRRQAAGHSRSFHYVGSYRDSPMPDSGLYAPQEVNSLAPGVHFQDRRNEARYLTKLSATVPRSAKRCFDVIVAFLLLVGLSPLLLALVLLVRRDGKPAFYRHKRLGAQGHAFYCIKFRSMVANADAVLADLLMRDPNAAAEWDATQKLRQDPRATAIGRFLRKTSLDELPQLLNVLRGDMSLVGPRPIVTSETRFYGEHIKDYYATRPGITGLWQVSGRSDTTYERRVQLDVAYVRNWSFWRDIIILLKTVPVVMLRGGAV